MTNTAETYNGWTNRETWAVNLHLTNDESLYLEVSRTMREAYESWEEPDFLRSFYAADLDREHEARMYAATEALEAFVRGMLESQYAEPGESSLAALLLQDLLGGALVRVDWPEIAKGFEHEIAAE